MIVSPDVGGVVRARAASPAGSTPTSPSSTSAASAPGVSEVMNIIGDVDGRHCILVDDIVDCAGTLCNAAEALVDSGADRRLRLRHARRVVGRRGRRGSRPRRSRCWCMTDSIVATEAVRASQNIRQLTIAPLIAEAIRRISEERSVSSLFD